MSRRTLAVAGLAVLALAAAILIGRWEAGHHAAKQNRGMRMTLEAVGPLDSPTLYAYRRLGYFDCLIYRRGAIRFALELCVDPQGRLVETIDRRSGEPRISSLREEHDRATIRLDRAEVDRLLRKAGAPDA